MKSPEKIPFLAKKQKYQIILVMRLGESRLRVSIDSSFSMVMILLMIGCIFK